MFQGWNDFFLLVGTAAATLIGLLFVVISLTSGMEKKRPRATNVYTTPVVFHLTMVLVASAFALAPHQAHGMTGAAVGLFALVGLGFAAYVGFTLALPNDVKMTDWTDLPWYAIAPAAVYVVLLGAAWAIWRDHALAPYLTGGALMALLLVSIRNAWDLVTYIAQMSQRPPT